MSSEVRHSRTAIGDATEPRLSPSQIPILDEAQIGLLRDALGPEDLHAMFAELPPAIAREREQIERAVAARDERAMRAAAHTLKGVANSFGAARLAALAKELEIDVDSIEAAVLSLPLLLDAIAQTNSALNRYGPARSEK